jgi:hypothetical protein
MLRVFVREVWLYNFFWRKKIGCKGCLKMLVKLTTVFASEWKIPAGAQINVHVSHLALNKKINIKST